MNGVILKLLIALTFFGVCVAIPPSLHAQKLAVIGDNHDDLRSLLRAILQAKAKGATHFLITGDAIRGDAKDLSRMLTLYPSDATINQKLDQHKEELERVLEMVLKNAGVDRSKVFFLKGNYEDRGYFHDDPTKVREASDELIKQILTPVMKIGEDRAVRDDELGIIEIPSEDGTFIYKLAVSHKPLIQLPYQSNDLRNTLVQSPMNQVNYRNWFRRASIHREPDTKATMNYNISLPSDVTAYIFGHTHIAGGFFHVEKSESGEARIIPSMNSGSLHPRKKPKDQHRSYMIVDLPRSRATWHDVAQQGQQVAEWDYGILPSNGDKGQTPEPSQLTGCGRVMKDNATALAEAGGVLKSISAIVGRLRLPNFGRPVFTGR